ncbi:4-(cytidine 5'-diphospho)-2-C-methyl-D-erythritol kinase [Pelagicoccus sp. SDUM812005]|uniref:4-(cytidine 5'-diphospho)-2-C-methyl-D-erythritol kinase n=1 Tax=Pelagicoccus sp. SDUM812005 TaxID=3041257 RepID=UPI00280ECC8D|nr:4-(cytidine 5'-diphospho)-2-C-methyl-D-erythritol kinase [Pelagicoccus sp. SDUM812005]MDQ8183207.1 4-(cytidine 5'-diphospho)-2-C-methyl-D-erythritol kinase [Pelagicoccus sp. SDUM812005]
MKVFVCGTMGQIEVFSPAKINLFLSVLGKMSSGFHELASLVAPVDFGDRIRIEVEDAAEGAVELSCSDSSLPTDRSNLAYAAAEGFLLRSGLNWRVKVELEKRIPHGAGLGGGSSNASSVLLGLSELAAERGALGLSRGERLELAAELGSDCPLFLEGKPVVMRGRGELLAPISPRARESLAGRELVLFKPSFSIGTAWAYRSLSEAAGAFDEREWSEGRLAAWEAGELSLESLLHNSFQQPSFHKFPALGALCKALEEREVACLMSGSGSCCFALVDSDEAADWVVSQVRACWGERSFAQRARLLG